jgi:large subunit ribosomal protein L31
MKKDLHPKYVMAKVICACGAEFTTRSTRNEIKLDICSECHPFFTGRQKMLDIAGRVDKFNKRFASTQGETLNRKPQKSGAKAIQASTVLSTTARKDAVAAKKVAEANSKKRGRKPGN